MFVFDALPCAPNIFADGRKSGVKTLNFSLHPMTGHPSL
jgi:hypothetical protein